MIVSQEEQLMANKQKKIDILDILVVVFLFSGAILNCYLYLLNKTNLSGQLAVIYVLVAVVAVFTAFFRFNRFLPKKFLGLILLFAAVFASFFITKSNYSQSVARFNSEFNLYLATIPSVILIAALVVWHQKHDISQLLIFTFDVLLTVVCGLVTVNSNGVTSAGLISDSSGFLYQNTSYYAACAFGLTMHVIQEKKYSDPILVPNSVLYILLPIQMVICILAGGRGGFVLLLVLNVWNILFGSRKIKSKVKNVIILLLTVFFIIFIAPKVVSLFGVDTTGLERIVRLITEGSNDKGRELLWSNSLAAFKNKPILGNGIGSVFYLFNSYSHNMFVDILCETGIIGLTIYIYVLYRFVAKAKIMYGQGSLFRFLIMIFVCGFTMNLFSGYVWVNQQILLPLAVILVYPENILTKMGRECNGDK